MGRLPATFANREIKDRFPYAIGGELELTTNQRAVNFPAATFQNGMDKPFEVHRMIPRVYARASTDVLLPTQPSQDLLAGLVRLDITITNLEQKLTKTAILIDTLTKGSAERTWEFADPWYLIASCGADIAATSLAFPTIENLDNLIVAITFEGFALVVAPPLANRA